MVLMLQIVVDLRQIVTRKVGFYVPLSYQYTDSGLSPDRASAALRCATSLKKQTNKQQQQKRSVHDVKCPKTLFINDERVWFRVWSKYLSTFFSGNNPADQNNGLLLVLVLVTVNILIDVVT